MVNISIDNYDYFFHSVRKALRNNDYVTVKKIFKKLYFEYFDFFGKLINESRLLTVSDIYEILSVFEFSELEYIVNNTLDFGIKISLFKKLILKSEVSKGEDLKYLCEMIYLCGVDVIEEIRSVYSSNKEYRNKILSYLAKDNRLVKNPNSINGILKPLTIKIDKAKSKLYEDFDFGLEFSGKLNGFDVKIYIEDEKNYYEAYNNLNEFMINLYDDRIPPILRTGLKKVIIHDQRDPGDYYSSLRLNNKRINSEFYAFASAFRDSFTSWSLCVPDLDTIGHELAHMLDRNFYKAFTNIDKKYFSEEYSDWGEAILKDGNSVSDYGDNNYCEDFAESVGLFVSDRKLFLKKFPNRANVLMDMLRHYTVNYLNLDNVKKLDDLIPIMLDYGISSEFIKFINKKNIPFLKVKRSFVEYVACGKNMSESLFINMNSLEDIQFEIFDLDNNRYR